MLTLSFISNKINYTYTPSLRSMANRLMHAVITIVIPVIIIMHMVKRWGIKNYWFAIVRKFTRCTYGTASVQLNDMWSYQKTYIGKWGLLCYSYRHVKLPMVKRWGIYWFVRKFTRCMYGTASVQLWSYQTYRPVRITML